MVQQANATYHLCGLFDALFDVGWVAEHLFAFGYDAATLDTDDGGTVENDFVNRSIQHVRTAVDGTKPGEPLGQLAKAVQRIQIRALAVASQRVAVQLDALNQIGGRFVDVVVVQVQRQGVAGEVLRVLVQPELGVQLLGRHALRVDVLPRFRIVLLEVLHEYEEVAETSFLEYAHQVRRQRLLLVHRHLVDLTALVHVATLDRLEFQVARHARVYEQLDQQSVGHQELGHQIDVPIASAPVLLFLRFAGAELLEQLLKRRDGRRLAAVVLVPVDVQHFLAGHRQHAGQDAFLEPGAQHYAVVLLVHRSATLRYGPDDDGDNGRKKKKKRGADRRARHRLRITGLLDGTATCAFYDRRASADRQQ